MTTATTEGRRLKLAVEGIDEAFLVDPLSAKRGKALTEEFVTAALGGIAVDRTEQIFIESFGPANYSRMTGLYVDEFDPATGAYVNSWSTEGTHTSDVGDLREYIDAPGEDGGTQPTTGVRYLARERLTTEPELDGEAIRQEEAEALCLCAFYWQTVVGMEAVRAFIEDGEGTQGSLKALSLLQIRLGLSPSNPSRSKVMESAIQEASSSATISTATSSASVRLPANKRGFLPPTGKRAKARRR